MTVTSKTLELNKNGKQRFIEYSITPLIDDELGKLGNLLLMRDKTHKHLEHEHIQYLSKHDQLTTLYNRRYFEEALIVFDFSKNLPISIIMGDLNGLKLINDSFGHAAGDELLVSAASLLKKHSRKKDVIARIGGDEFVMIAPNTSENEASKIVQNIKADALSTTFNGVNLSISFGFATKMDMNKNLAKVLREAEEFMYKHKLFESTSMHSKTLDLMISSLFDKNQIERFHSQRVSEMCELIGKQLGYSEEIIKRISIAGLMHDIGKIGISDEILNKPGSLTQDEYYNIKRHSEIGYRILSSVNEFSDIGEYVLEHHERCDGKGYPKGLFADEIHPISKIISVVDAFDSMTNVRTYGNIRSIREAILELEKNIGTQFDETVVSAVKVIYKDA